MISEGGCFTNRNDNTTSRNRGRVDIITYGYTCTSKSNRGNTCGFRDDVVIWRCRILEDFINQDYAIICRDSSDILSVRLKNKCSCNTSKLVGYIIKDVVVCVCILRSLRNTSSCKRTTNKRGCCGKSNWTFLTFRCIREVDCIFNNLIITDELSNCSTCSVICQCRVQLSSLDKHLVGRSNTNSVNLHELIINLNNITREERRNTSNGYKVSCGEDIKRQCSIDWRLNNRTLNIVIQSYQHLGVEILGGKCVCCTNTNCIDVKSDRNYSQCISCTCRNFELVLSDLNCVNCRW